MVRQETLTLCIGGSNPSAFAKKYQAELALFDSGTPDHRGWLLGVPHLYWKNERAADADSLENY